MPKPRREVVLLLPVALDEFAERAVVEELLAAEVAAVVEPGRVPTRPHRGLMRRMRRRLPREPRAIVFIERPQQELAHALADLLPPAEVHQLAPAELASLLPAGGPGAGTDAAQDVDDVRRQLRDGT
jgi:hypothetical protein